MRARMREIISMRRPLGPVSSVCALAATLCDRRPGALVDRSRRYGAQLTRRQLSRCRPRTATAGPDQHDASSADGVCRPRHATSTQRRAYRSRARSPSQQDRTGAGAVEARRERMACAHGILASTGIAIVARPKSLSRGHATQMLPVWMMRFRARMPPRGSIRMNTGPAWAGGKLDNSRAEPAMTAGTAVR